jgi:anti-sigma factor RsiW
MTDDEVRSLLRSLRDEPVPADSLARVCLAVAERSEAAKSRRRFVLPWKFVGLLASAALTILAVVLFSPTRQTTPPAAKIRQEVVTTKEVPPPPIVNVEPQKPVMGATKSNKTRRDAKPKSKDMVVRIETADPDVVILLIGD